MPQATAEETQHRKKTLSRERIIVGAMALAFLLAGMRLQHQGLCWLPSEEALRATSVAEQDALTGVEPGVFSPLATGYLRLYKPFGEPLCAMSSSGHVGDLDVSRSLPQRLPFLIAALLLGLSMAFVVKKFFGGRAALIASSLYFTSPFVVGSTARCNPSALAAWGAYGVIFTAIATAHTLYAPREVILWNWKRILMLGCSIALAIGAMPMLAFLLPPAFVLMLWVAPHRWRAATAIMACGVGVSAALLGALACLLPLDYWRMAYAKGWLQWPALELPAGHWLSDIAPITIASMIALAPFWLALAALFVFCFWRRPRFFGNCAPLSIGAAFVAAAALLNVCGVRIEHLLLCAMPFLLTFFVGVEADLAEKGWRRLGNFLLLAVVSLQIVATAFLTAIA